MSRFLLSFICLMGLTAMLSHAQPAPGVIPVATDPTGNNCFSPVPIQVTNPAGNLYTCQNGTVAKATGAANPTATCAGTVTSCAVTVTSLGLTSATSNTAITKCYVSSTGAELTITSSAWSGGPPYTTFTPNFTSTTGVYCTVNSNGGQGATGATGAQGPTGTVNTTGTSIQKANGAGGITAAVVGDFYGIAIICPDTSGSSSAYTCTGSPVPTTYSNMTGFFLTPQTNGAGGSMTVNISGIGNISLYDQTCSSTLTSSALVAGSTYWFAYTGGKGCLASGAGGGGGGSSPVNLTPSFSAGGTTTCAWTGTAGGTCSFTMSGGNTTVGNTGQVAGPTYWYNITNDSTPRTLGYQANQSTGAAMPASAGAMIQFSCTYVGTTFQCNPSTWINGPSAIVAPEAAACNTTVASAGNGCIHSDSTLHILCHEGNGASGQDCAVKTGGDMDPTTGHLTITTTTCSSQFVSAISARGVGTCTSVVPAVTVTTGTTATLSTPYTFNQEATAGQAVAYTLPTATAGVQFCVDNSYNGSAANTGALTVNASAAGQYIIYTDGTLSASGGYVISGGAARDGACFSGVDGTHWMFYPHSPSGGTWTKH